MDLLGQMELQATMRELLRGVAVCEAREAAAAEAAWGRQEDHRHGGEEQDGSEPEMAQPEVVAARRRRALRGWRLVAARAVRVRQQAAQHGEWYRWVDSHFRLS